MRGGFRETLLIVGLLALTAGGGYLANRVSYAFGFYMGTN
ncbi:hypothetical protein SAMN04488241_104256 [Sphingomonas rubra]|uniref:Uncharacterized protein n=1 Tax=Sphingomonas rubra TaxID=634430 RepID=A0A1I5S0J6_9SPHN|nr:hypothetical protein SAMN04488241_104256 [Sphingomonas rubra]